MSPSQQLEAKVCLAANLRRLRKERGWSQETLADLADMHATVISRVERCMREPQLQTVVQLAAALKVSVQDLIDPPESEAGKLVAEARVWLACEQTGLRWKKVVSWSERRVIKEIEHHYPDGLSGFLLDGLTP